MVTTGMAKQAAANSQAQLGGNAFWYVISGRARPFVGSSGFLYFQRILKELSEQDTDQPGG
jgi:hypothetical protein